MQSDQYPNHGEAIAQLMNEAGTRNWQGSFETQMTVTLCTIVVRVEPIAIVMWALTDDRYSRVSSIQMSRSFLGCGNMPRLLVRGPRRSQNRSSKASGLGFLRAFPSCYGLQSLIYQRLKLRTVRYGKTAKQWQICCLLYPDRYPPRKLHKSGCQCTLNNTKLVSKLVMAFCWPKQFNSIALSKLSSHGISVFPSNSCLLLMIQSASLHEHHDIDPSGLALCHFVS